MGEIRMSDIIALQGRAKCGKTTTLKLLIEKIIKKYAVPEEKQAWKIKRTDFMVILEIEISGKALRIGITTYGDPNSKLQEHIQTFLSEKCELIYCACRTSGMTVDWVNSFAISHTVRFVQKLIGTNYDVLNQKQADELLVLGKI